MIGLDKSWLQLNVYNLFDEVYVGGFGGGLSQNTSTRTVPNTDPSVRIPIYGGAPFAQIGAPRTIMASVNLGF